LRVLSPVNVRPAIGRTEDVALTIAFGATRHPAGEGGDIWSEAREIGPVLAQHRTPEGLAAFYGGMEALMASRPGVSGIDGVERRAAALDMMVTNLGAPPIETAAGAFRLRSVWGPALFVGLEGEQLVGVATVDDAIHLLHASYSAIPSLLERAEVILRQSAS
jgi:hypothetical protein